MEETWMKYIISLVYFSFINFFDLCSLIQQCPRPYCRTMDYLIAMLISIPPSLVVEPEIAAPPPASGESLE
jgi:hypothetical protein